MIQQPLKLEKNKHRLEILPISEKILIYVSLNLKTINFYLIKLAADFDWQPSYLLGGRASLNHTE